MCTKKTDGTKSQRTITPTSGNKRCNKFESEVMKQCHTQPISIAKCEATRQRAQCKSKSQSQDSILPTSMVANKMRIRVTAATSKKSQGHETPSSLSPAFFFGKGRIKIGSDRPRNCKQRSERDAKLNKWLRRKLTNPTTPTQKHPLLLRARLSNHFGCLEKFLKVLDRDGLEPKGLSQRVRRSLYCSKKSLALT